MCLRYHRHGTSCEEARRAAQAWLQWLRVDRAAVLQRLGKTIESDIAHRRAQAEADKVWRQLKADEQYKAQNCRLCPHASASTWLGVRSAIAVVVDVVAIARCLLSSFVHGSP